MKTRSAPNQTSKRLSAPELVHNANGAGNETMHNGIKVMFKYNANKAGSVAVAGSFNNWDSKKTPLIPGEDCWSANVELSPGRYEYRFVVDGKWLSDPNAKESVANPYGENNSVISL